MECRTLDLTIISADDLKKVNLFTKMDVYVVVLIIDSTNHHNPVYVQKQKTPVDKYGNKKPMWNYLLKFILNDAALHNNRLTLLFKIFSNRVLLPDKLIGEIHLSVSDLMLGIRKGDSTHVSYQVSKKSGKLTGSLDFSYRFGERYTEHVHGQSTLYPYPPTAVSGYPEPAYAYPAQVNGYGNGYPAVQAQGQGRRSKFGMGVGTGLLGGALAGLFVGDLVSDIGDNGGYGDGGFDDGGFDFGGF